MELATGVVGVLILAMQILIPESVTISSIFNLFVVGLIWVSYKVAKIWNAVDLRLLIIAFSYQLFSIWIVGIFFSMIFAAVGMVILAFFGIILDLNVALIFVFIMIFLITAGSRKASRKFTRNRWLDILTDNYRTLSINQRYTNTALAAVEKCLPHPLVAFFLFFLVYWTGQPDLWSSLQLGTWIGLLLFYTIYKVYLYSEVKMNESENW